MANKDMFMFDGKSPLAVEEIWFLSDEEVAWRCYGATKSLEAGLVGWVHDVGLVSENSLHSGKFLCIIFFAFSASIIVKTKFHCCFNDFIRGTNAHVLNIERSVPCIHTKIDGNICWPLTPFPTTRQLKFLLSFTKFCQVILIQTTVLPWPL